MRCPACDQSLPDGSARCFRCGKTLLEGDASLPHMFPDGEPSEEPAPDVDEREVSKPWWQFWRRSS
jgi:hypothetical protein